MIERPSYLEVLTSSASLAARVATLEEALTRISDLSVAGTWPSWEMGMIARKALGPRFERRHNRYLHDKPTCLFAAQGIEARQGQDAQRLDRNDESPVAKPCAQPSSEDNPHA